MLPISVCETEVKYVSVCRWETMLFLTSDCKSAPAAKLRSNIFGTHYELKLDPSMLPFDHEWSAQGAMGGKDDGRQPHCRCETLLDVQYKTRLKGFMRPRRCLLLALLVVWGFPGVIFPEHDSGNTQLGTVRPSESRIGRS